MGYHRAGFDVVGTVRRPARPAQGRLLRLDPVADEHGGALALPGGRCGCTTRLRGWVETRLRPWTRRSPRSGRSTAITRGAVAFKSSRILFSSRHMSIVLLNLATPISSQKARIACGV